MLSLSKYTSKRSWHLWLLSFCAMFLGAFATFVTGSLLGLALGASASIMLTWPLASELLCVLLTGYAKKTVKEKV